MAIYHRRWRFVATPICSYYYKPSPEPASAEGTFLSKFQGYLIELFIIFIVLNGEK